MPANSRWDLIRRLRVKGIFAFVKDPFCRLPFQIVITTACVALCVKLGPVVSAVCHASLYLSKDTGWLH